MENSGGGGKNDNKTIVWFRRDLRIEDNPALASAAKEGSVFPVYIWCPTEEGQYHPGRVSRWWLKQSLAHLARSLDSLGSALALIKAHSTLEALLDCVAATGASRVVFNRLYDPVSLVRDHGLKEKLTELGVLVQSFDADLLFEPWEVYDEAGHAFAAFEAYWEKCLRMPAEPASLLPPWKLSPALATGNVGACSIEELGLEDESEKSSNALLGRAWSPGWSNADKALTEFVEDHLAEYSKNRLKLGGNNNTSLLSPYLHFGEVSVRKVFQSARMKQILWAKEGNAGGGESVGLFLKAVGLREYSRYLCFNFPFTHERSLLSNLKFFPWDPSPGNFKAWRQGRTGYPLVDAGMRELWATGWIHNRIRVIVSSFCVKVLLLPWRWGMKYFWDTLLDADLESDILGWQYISGSLPDGHELERLDSPELQGSKFDPEGDYVRQWLPELARLPAEWIHHPWDAPEYVLRASGVDLGLNYPRPIIEIDAARDRLTAAIFKMRELEAAARAAESNGRDEEVVDNSDRIEGTDIPRVILKPMAATCRTYSSNDQRVPSFRNARNDGNGTNKKRLLRSLADDAAAAAAGMSSRPDEELCSTAESSAAKRRAAASVSCSFHVPESVSMSTVNASQECESSDVLRPGPRGQADVEESSSKNGFESLFCGAMQCSADPRVQPQQMCHEKRGV